MERGYGDLDWDRDFAIGCGSVGFVFERQIRNHGEILVNCGWTDWWFVWIVCKCEVGRWSSVFDELVWTVYIVDG